MGTGLRTRAGNADVLGGAFLGVLVRLLDTYRPTVEALLRGEPVILDDDLEITTNPSTDGGHSIDLFIVRPGADKKVRVQLRAHDGRAPDDDPTSSIPPPGPWQTTDADGAVVWRLFNAVVLNLEQPHNAAAVG
ncbi:MAG: hypothetical protein ABIS35_12685 [Terracoccus sp.]